MNIVNLLCYVVKVDFEVHMYLVICCPVTIICAFVVWIVKVIVKVIGT